MSEYEIDVLVGGNMVRRRVSSELLTTVVGGWINVLVSGFLVPRKLTPELLTLSHPRETPFWYTPSGQQVPITQAALDDIGYGSSVPAWVPEGAVAHIDFVNDRAWTEAGGEVAIAALAGTDPNTENAWSETEYDPGNLSPDGYGISVGSTALAFIGDARTRILGEFTLAVRVKNSGTGDYSFLLAAADGNDALEIDINTGVFNRVLCSSYQGDINVTLTNQLNVGTGVSNGVAFTIAGSRCEVAANGNAPATGEIDESDRPPGNPFVAGLFDISPVDGTRHIQTITIYDALPDADGLSELSEI